MKAYVYEKPGVAKLIDKESQSLRKVQMQLLEWSKLRFVVQTYILSRRYTGSTIKHNTWS